MNDKEVLDTLLKLRPKKAPASMDGPVLSLADVSARRAALFRRKRMMPGFAACAAAVLVLACAFIFFPPRQKPGLSNRGDVAEGGFPTLRPKAGVEALLARAMLLELKITRLGKLAGYSQSSESLKRSLDTLKRKLEDIDYLFMNAMPVGTETDRNKPKSNGGNENEKSSSLFHGICPDPVGSGVLPG